MKTRILVKEGEYQLSKAFCMDPKIDAQELYCYLTGLDKVSLFLKAEEEVDPETEEKYMELIRRRAERIPLQHITGVQEFMGYTFRVNPHGADPAPGHGDAGHGGGEDDPEHSAREAFVF